jgi:ribonuclease Z
MNPVSNSTPKPISSPTHPAFAPRLVNGPFGDPGLYIHLRLEGRAVVFDLGQNEALSTTEMLRVSHVFVSHCHMDHFFGFDRLLRMFLAHDKTLHLFGPPGIIDCVAGKLRGYTWNLVDGYGFAIEVTQVGRDTMQRTRFQAATGFLPEALSSLPFTGTLLEEPNFFVRTTHLDHRIDSLAFALEEKTHLNVDTAVLSELEVGPGPWLAEVKRAFRAEEPDDFGITAEWRHAGQHYSRAFVLGELRNRLVKQTRGQKLAYVVDTLYNPDNAARIADLAHGSDIFFCESPFLNSDEDQATKRYHLTARQAGLLGRAAKVQKLVVFHFSPRYSGQAEELYKEARDTFQAQEVPASE